jgi:hypothetical protein
MSKNRANDEESLRRSIEWDELVESAAETRRRFEVWYGSVETAMKERPGAALAFALGAGFVLGGGVFTRLTLRVLLGSITLATRAAGLALAGQSLSKALEGNRDRREHRYEVSSPA